jgi:hypothetical protein
VHHRGSRLPPARGFFATIGWWGTKTGTLRWMRTSGPTSTEREIGDPPAQQLDVGLTSQGDVAGTYLLWENTRVRARFECSRRCGFNLSRLQLFNDDQSTPKRDVRLEWKQSPNRLWYVRSLDDMRVVLDPRLGIMRVRDVMKYTDFDPDAKVDASRFMEASLQDQLAR